MKTEKQQYDISEVPFLLDNGKIPDILTSGKLILFLDFDGTLSPIVSRPEKAFLLPGMKEVLEKCASKFKVALVSGRDTDDVRMRAGVDGLIYAGSHGFSIKGPGGLQMEHEKADQITDVLDKIEHGLREKFSGGPEGVQVERKKYAITVHYRNSDPSDLDEIKAKTGDVTRSRRGIKTEGGKMIIEIKPDIDWHKGMAVKWILERLGHWNDPSVLPVYIGDDVTDEDAFRVLGGKGIGIIVGYHDEPTSADFRLRDVNEVKQFLEMIVR